jgi:hypothetical protein
MQLPAALWSRPLRLAATLAFAVAALVPLAASAAPITVPTGLSPGEQYRLAFLTSTTRDASSTSIADYNAFVTNVAGTVPELVALGTTWAVIGSTNPVSARDNTATNPLVDGPGVAIYLLNDTLLVDDYADLWDSTIDNPLDVNELGTPHPSNVVVWTGTLTNGASASSHLGQAAVIYGVSDHTDHFWSSGGQLVNATPRPFYAISGILTVPEPSTAALLALGVLVSVVARRRI